MCVQKGERESRCNTSVPINFQNVYHTLVGQPLITEVVLAHDGTEPMHVDNVRVS